MFDLVVLYIHKSCCRRLVVFFSLTTVVRCSQLADKKRLWQRQLEKIDIKYLDQPRGARADQRGERWRRRVLRVCITCVHTGQDSNKVQQTRSGRECSTASLKCLDIWDLGG